jgi:2-polyprenyl-3-methyl-5-hydroxy-6-metoxy-1,4-benzoquinol methylase
MWGVTTSPAEHWDGVYQTRATDEVSWFQAEPATSLRLVTSMVPTTGSVLDVGAGSSTLVDSLLAQGFRDLTVVDVSERALQVVRERLGAAAGGVSLVHTDLLDWEPARTFDVWHDRAVFHFLTAPGSRSLYVRQVETAVVPGGSVIVATFAADGPTHCSGLPVCRYDVAGLRAEFGSGFDLVHSEREEHRTPAGVVQPFVWVVLRRRRARSPRAVRASAG